jgi:flagellar basal-body rod protein FlgF
VGRSKVGDVMEVTSLVLLSRQDALIRQMEVVANNVANVNTTGYKRQQMVFDDYMAKTQPGQRTDFVIDRGSFRDVTNGSLVQTSNPLDIALEGNGYIPVQTPQGTMYTRAGAFELNAEGELVNASGFKVLSGDGQPIVIPPEAKDIQIDKEGNIRTDIGQAGQIQAMVFKDEQELTEKGNGLYQSKETPQPEPATRIVQGAVERSNVQPVVEMTQMVEVLRAYQQTGRLLESEHERMRNAIRTLGRVSS